MGSGLTAKATVGVAACAVLAFLAALLTVPISVRLNADYANLERFRVASPCEQDTSTDPAHPTCLHGEAGVLTAAYVRRGSKSSRYYYVNVAIPGRPVQDRVEIDRAFFVAVAVGDRVRTTRWGEQIVHVDDVDRGISADARQTPLTPVVAETLGVWAAVVVFWAALIWGGLTVRRAGRGPVDLALGPVTFFRWPTLGSRVVAASWIGWPTVLAVAIAVVNELSVGWIFSALVVGGLLTRLELKNAGHPVLTLSSDGVRVGHGHGVVQPWSDVLGIQRVRAGRSSYDVIAFRRASPLRVNSVTGSTAVNQAALVTIRERGRG